ncbi:AsnC family protein [Salmonella enterica subsp. diarizonae]|uniref:AsnC family protein n=1 Tax=Salmonella diarizonae TaxID=59204 RepID=A0A5Y3VZY9_SALDZ|nr:AsnC family protein [Salmonella enterica subsp. diarizonae]ECJ4376986.1 AsnC family protein [Salmonella enterica subsp. diarizonae]
MILKPMGIPGICPKHERAWTPEEDELLISLYGKKTMAEIVPLLPAPGRTLYAIAKRLEVLRCLYPDRVSCLLRRYTREEDDFILKNCHTMTIAEVASHLVDRNPRSVQARASVIGAKFYKCGERRHNARYTDDFVIRVQGWRDDLSLTFGEIDRRLGLPRMTAWRLYHERLTADYAISKQYMPR